MQKTLGGDRLGSGKKMKVELHPYDRASFDMGYIFRSTMAAGTLVPFLSEVALPGDTFDIELDAKVLTQPTIGPLYGSYKVQLDVFLIPIRLYNSWLHNNMLNIGRNMSAIKLPQLDIPAEPIADPEELSDIDNATVNPSSLLAYLGIRGTGLNITEESTTREFNAIPVLAYWDIYKNYYANKQEEVGAVLHTPSEAIIETVDPNGIEVGGTVIPEYPSVGSKVATVGMAIEINYTGTQPLPSQIIVGTNQGEKLFSQVFQTTTPGASPITGAYIGAYGPSIDIQYWRYVAATDSSFGAPSVYMFDLNEIDEMRNLILSTPGNQVFYPTSKEPYSFLQTAVNGVNNVMSSQEGLGLKTYQSDMFNNWLKTENIEDITTASAVAIVGGQFTMDQLNIAKKVYNMLNRINVSGGTYDDWLDAVYTNERFTRPEIPMYMGGLSKELVFQEVVSNTQTEAQPLGTLAGRGVLSGKHKGGKVIVKVDEPAYVIGLVSITPRIDYSQGNKWDVHLKTVDDLHKPALDQIGFQDLVTEQMAWWDTTYNSTTNLWVQRSAGKQPAWLNYMTNVNRVYGNFAMKDNEMFMTLNRRYERDTAATVNGPQILDLTTYIDPSKFNFIFAETALDAQNFWTQISVDMIARRKMSAKIIPNL